MIIMGKMQYAIEDKKMFDFDIDEHALRINHYFKRKEAIFSKTCLFGLLPISILRIVLTLIYGRVLNNSYVAWIEYFALLNIAITVAGFVVTKIIT